MKSESELEVLLSGVAPMLEEPGPQAIEVTGRGAVGVVGWIGAPPDTGSVASAPLPAPLASPHSGSPEVSRLRAALRQAVAAIRSGNDVSPETVRTLARTLEQCPGGYQWLASAVVIDGPAIGYVFPADARMWLHAIVATDGARDEIIERLGRDRLDTADTSSRVEQDEFPARVGDLSGDRLRSAADTMVAVIDDLADELGPPSSMPSGTDRSSGFQHRLPSLRAKLQSVLDQDTAELGIEEARVLARVAIEYRRVALGMGLLAAPSPVAPQSR